MNAYEMNNVYLRNAIFYKNFAYTLCNLLDDFKMILNTPEKHEKLWTNCFFISQLDSTCFVRTSFKS